MTNKLYFKIGDVAHKFNVKPSLIRYWEKEFSYINPKKNSKGTRYYTQQDISHFELIHHLIKEKGMTIQGVKDYVSQKKKNKSMDKLEVIVTLKNTRKLLSDIRDIFDSRIEK